MTEGLITTLVEHAAGNYRVLTTLAAELLATVARTQFIVRAPRAGLI